jgi:DNA-binding transcriptional ArsR family regulator
MNVCSTILVTEIAKSTELAGAADGAAWFLAARQQFDGAAAGMHLIDFQGVRLATVSWLREAVLALRKYASVMRPDILLVVANLAPLVREEFEVALEATGNLFIDLGRSTGSGFDGAVLMGTLDPALRETLTAVDGKAEFDASLVCRLLGSLAPSAANNRLAALELKGILTSSRRGRTRVYRPLVEDMRYGN